MIMAWILFMMVTIVKETKCEFEIDLLDHFLFLNLVITVIKFF